MDGFICPSTDMYDSEVIELIKGIQTKSKYESNLLKNKLKKFVREQGYIPCRTSSNAEEKYLAKQWNSLSAKNSGRYDAELVAYIKQFPTWNTFKKIDKSSKTQERLNELYEIKCLAAKKYKN